MQIELAFFALEVTDNDNGYSGFENLVENFKLKPMGAEIWRLGELKFSCAIFKAFYDIMCEQ